MMDKSMAHRLAIQCGLTERKQADGGMDLNAYVYDFARACYIAGQEAERDNTTKAERRAIEFSDIVAKHVTVMRAAVVAGHLESPANGMQWIVNTLYGPGHIPDLDEARSLGGAQALFDKEMAEHEEFRKAHPAP